MSNPTVLLSGSHFLEGPRWHDGSWWASDMFGGEVIAVPDGGGQPRRVPVDGRPSGLGWLPDGTMLVVSMDSRQILAVGDHGSRLHADLSAFTDSALNDMVVDGTGTAWVGYFGFDFAGGAAPEPGGLLRVAPDGAVSVAATDLLVPNGAVVGVDGVTLVVAETLASRLTAFTITVDGQLEGRRVWAELGSAPRLGSLRETLAQLQMAPDGIAVDAEGAIWVADAIGGACHRVEHGGTVTDVLHAPMGLSTFACAVGGADNRAVALCCAPDASEKRRRRSTDSVLLRTCIGGDVSTTRGQGPSG